jgi:hypothetical protein
MRRILALFAFSAVFSMLALAESWNGKLLDSSCYDQQKKVDSCDATSTTSSFTLSTSSGFYKLDAAGNSKAAAAMKNRADRSEPGKAPAKAVSAKVEGKLSGSTISVEEIEVQ